MAQAAAQAILLAPAQNSRPKYRVDHKKNKNNIDDFCTEEHLLIYIDTFPYCTCKECKRVRFYLVIAIY